MNDPKRWLEEGATSEERELLEAGRSAAMPGVLREKVWLGVSAGAAGLCVAGQVAGSAAIGAARDATALLGGAASGKGVLAGWVGSAAAKGVIAIAIVGSAGVGVVKLHSLSVPRADVALGRAPAVERPNGKTALAAEERAEGRAAPGEGSAAGAPPVTGVLDSLTHAEPVAAAGQGPKGVALGARRPNVRPAPSVAPPSDEAVLPRESPAEMRAVSRLREESAAVLAIRKTLLGGDPGEALRMLDRARSDFPAGALAEEREALAVRALVASGQGEAARQRGSAFLRAHPKSPHVSEVRALAGL
jgi:hypothetical protein